MVSCIVYSRCELSSELFWFPALFIQDVNFLASCFKWFLALFIQDVNFLASCFGFLHCLFKM